MYLVNTHKLHVYRLHYSVVNIYRCLLSYLINHPNNHISNRYYSTSWLKCVLIPKYSSNNNKSSYPLYLKYIIINIIRVVLSICNQQKLLKSDSCSLNSSLNYYQHSYRRREYMIIPTSWNLMPMNLIRSSYHPYCHCYAHYSRKHPHCHSMDWSWHPYCWHTMHISYHISGRIRYYKPYWTCINQMAMESLDIHSTSFRK